MSRFKRVAKKPSSKTAQLEQVLSSLEHEALAAEVRDLLCNDDRLLENFLLRHRHLTGNSEPLSKRYRQLFDKIVRAHADRGFIDYRSAWGFSSEVTDLLSTLADEQIAAADQMDGCFSIIQGLLRDVLNSIDDSDGGMGMLIEQIRGILGAAYPRLSPQQQAGCFQQALKYHYGGLEDYGLELNGLLAEWSEGHADFQALYLAELERKITQADRDWSREWSMRQKYQLLMQWGRMDEATTLASQHMNVAEFREHFVQQALDAEDTVEARRLIHEGIAIAEQSRFPGVVVKWREQLLSMAEQANDLPAVREELFRLMAGSWLKLDLYKRYKATYEPEEWEVVRHEVYEQIKAKGAHAESLAGILDEENELAALFKLIRGQETHSAIPLFKRYVKRLATEFPEEVVEVYVQAIHTDMHSTGRKTYEQAVRDMRVLAALPGGEGAMQDLLAEFRQVYKNRKAMLEVFRGAFG